MFQQLQSHPDAALEESCLMDAGLAQTDPALAAALSARRQACQAGVLRLRPAAGVQLPCGTYTWTAERLTRYLPGHTWESHAEGIRWREYYAPGGAYFGEVSLRGVPQPRYQGRWRLDGAAVCRCEGDCTRERCREISQQGACPEPGLTWTQERGAHENEAWVRLITAGDPFGLAQ